MLIMVTGSRTFLGPKATGIIRRALRAYWEPGAVLMTGGCPQGADDIAETLWQQATGQPARVVDAAWSTYAKAAGPIRNKAMVDLRPDVCLAFSRGGSTGTEGAAEMAKKAGILTVVHYYPETPAEFAEFMNPQLALIP